MSSKLAVPKLDPDKVITRLRNQLNEANLQLAQYGALADQLLEENTRLQGEMDQMKADAHASDQ